MDISGVKTWQRDKNIFANRGNLKRGDLEQIDLSNIRILHAGVDTIRQIVSGQINLSTLALIEGHLSAGFKYSIVLGSYEFAITKAGSSSGYQYILKNMYYGITVLFKSFYAESDTHASHLKIEYSPHFIHHNDVVSIDQTTVDIASMFLAEFDFEAIAVHLAVDIKGFEIPKNLETRLKTKAKRSFAFTGIDSIDFDLNTVAVRYGQNESYTFGNAGSLQFCMYEKTKEANKTDKIHFWESIWKTCPGIDDPFEPEYEEGDKVVRLEARFHQKVIKEFCQGTKGFEAKNFSDLSMHLTGLFKYFLANFRLHHNKNFIDPLWQLLLEDVTICRPMQPMFYKRCYKRQSSKSKRNVAFWMGNAMRLFARNNYAQEYIVKYFLESGLISEFKDYFGMMPNSTVDDVSDYLRDYVSTKLEYLQLNGVSV